VGIVLLTAAGQVENRYAAYTGEILRTEGYNQLRTTDIEELTAPLSDQALYVLTPCRLTPVQVQLLLDHVANGGRLIAIRPSKPLVSALGLGLAGSATVDGYVTISEHHAVGKALIHESIQFHGGAAHLALTEQVTSWEQVAELWATVTQPSGYPALVIVQHGAGRVAIYAYDVGETIAAIRQGDPRLANCTTTSVVDGRFRPADMFMGHTDPAKAHIPQADVHGNLLANTVHWMSPQPLVRLWYYPQPEQRSALVMTSDDDWSKLHEFEALMQALEAVEGHITFYLMEDTAVTREHVQQWAARGHSFGVHPYIREPYARYAQVEGHISRHIQSFADRFGFRPITTRSHCAGWVDYLGGAHILVAQGIAMQFNYGNRKDLPLSYTAGSGRPMKMVKQDGHILDIFQQPSHIGEDTLLAPSIAPYTQGWTTEEASERVTGLIDVAANRYHTPLCLNSHPRSFVRYSGEFVTAVIHHAHRRGVPILSADEWQAFTRARRAVLFSDVQRQKDGLSLRLEVRRPLQNLTVMIPVENGRRKARVALGGQALTASVTNVFGFNFLMVPVDLSSVKLPAISVDWTTGGD
jgi:hypothetical protein